MDRQAPPQPPLWVIKNQEARKQKSPDLADLKAQLQREGWHAVEHTSDEANEAEYEEIYARLPPKMRRYVEGCATAENAPTKRRRVTEAIVSWALFWDHKKAADKEIENKINKEKQALEAAEYKLWYPKQKNTETYIKGFLEEEKLREQIEQQVGGLY